METGPTYRALVVEESTEHRYTRTVKELPFAALPDGELLIRVSYSSLNYKDALSAAGNRGVTRRYPTLPGLTPQG